ncbi:MAG: hypothetical protein A2087_00930 [Spirochaetes bacterium GWD1_61_31]|nr:MAG: hypothetical protein A2Y37_03355 [Spirochaetes bacterium GWB1_60_80]OHD29644.1 MAG: hypothetical protein A2004_01895 [Spirochaetes bacterium GWC1_61_12]OHD37550.1 MAG: hypothetical protein A2087_00930 [Spirochaetes bacterium GWD1_61_31]OHD61793.1 MAG: hypothetical protein A2Y32_13615 [Spirochaetes bacterium GWF1_60_12]
MMQLEVRNLRKRWPELTIDAAFTVEAGSLLAIVGPSGCGKSTILRMIAGLLPADSGQLIVNGRDISAALPRERSVGMVFQDYALFPHLDVGANVGYSLAGLGRLERARQVQHWLDLVDLNGYAKRKIHELSGGEKQRVALARTLAAKPAVILFDEPLSSLDAGLRQRLRQELREEQLRLGFTAIYVTHDLEEAMALADQVAIMVDGRILQVGSPELVWRNPTSVQAATFLGNMVVVPVLAVYPQAEGGVHLDTGLGKVACSQPPQPPDGLPSDATPLALAFDRGKALPDVPEPAAGDLVFPGRCLRSDFLGDFRDYAIQSHESNLMLRGPAETSIQVGTDHDFTIPSGQLVWLYR